VDIVSHGLASFAVARGFFPRSGKVAMVAAIAAGVLADADWVCVYFGPSAFLTWHRTCFHSILSAVLLAIVLAAIFRPILKEMKEPQAPRLLPVFLAALCTSVLHVAMDACQSSGVMLLWPFNSRRFALDWLPDLDPWILTILVACIAVPELLRLVSSEIGAKEKKPRGQTGALIGLAFLVLYTGARATLHSNALAALESRTFHGEAARRAAALPESLSLVAWHGIAETESALDEMEVDAAATGTLDADLSQQLFKPQGSPALERAEKTAVARRFLGIAQMPKAGVEKTNSGYQVVFRDLRYAASGERAREIAALVELDFNNAVTSEQLVWARDLP
jgi:membrane-bound metal-dependent hydrolase YbcI (DUF457 family)